MFRKSYREFANLISNAVKNLQNQIITTGRHSEQSEEPQVAKYPRSESFSAAHVARMRIF